MNADNAQEIFLAVENLGQDLGSLILAIDKVEDAEERKTLRRGFAEVAGLIEERFIFDICTRHPEFRNIKPEW